MQISVLLDRSRPETLTTQMVDQIREAIRCVRIGPGTRLPSSRRLSEQLARSRNTAVRAYDLLLMEGIVESRPASGIYVAELLPSHSAPVRPAFDTSDRVLRTRMPMPLRLARYRHDRPVLGTSLHPSSPPLLRTIIWPHDFGDNRLYAVCRCIGHPPTRPSCDRVAIRCPF